MNYKDDFNVPFTPSPISEKDLGRGRIFTLRGPRQVGKTRFLKHLLNSHPQLRPVYESLDIVRTDRELVALVRRIIREQEPKLVLLDEISSVPRWQKAIKYLSDKDELAGIDFVLSGSSATDIKRGAERLPGRRGPEVENGWDRILLPLSFHQFAKHTALLGEDEINLIISNSSSPHLVPAELHEKLKDAFFTFLKVGGFPTSILAFETNEQPPQRTMMGIIRSDFEKRKRSRIILDQVLSRVNETSGTAITWETFAKPITSTKIIVRQYIDELCENYLLQDIECIDLARNRAAPRKPRKLYWIDPLIPSALMLDGIGRAIDESYLIESIVSFELLRRNEQNLWEGLNQLRHVYLWRDSRGHEIDFVVFNGKKQALEIKWQNTVSEWDAKNLNKTFGGGILLSKEQFAKFGNTLVLPVYWYLFILSL